ncbi:MAG TPA: fibronectin type III domain-containing protein, partial [Clostridia bacterium]|nr:fibronectin type III domain-containing protein [Clostridia bacterium]
MRKALCVVTSLLFLSLATHTSRADSTWELAVQVSAEVQSTPPKITLRWPADTLGTPETYTVYRKTPLATNWSTKTVLHGNATEYVDTAVQTGRLYEYQIIKKGPQYTGYGYIASGIELPPTEYRGKLLLVVDRTYARELAMELSRLQQDLAGDGWTVVRLDVNRDDSPVAVKSRIKAEYDADPGNVKSVFLFGRVPVPYSGNVVPDGHNPDHQGAWPADGYYGDMDGLWTDNSVEITCATDVRNRNVPGDGKFDPSAFPSAIELMVGRVDLANMP